MIWIFLALAGLATTFVRFGSLSTEVMFLWWALKSALIVLLPLLCYVAWRLSKRR